MFQNGASIGQRSGLSDKDVKKLNKMYCDGDTDDTHATEDEKEKPTKKKKPKSTPFQGHGIGYHQGKTVVIKLNPEAKTYKITSIIPRYHVFDHFSTTPQTLSPTTFFEGTGTAKEINYEYATPNYNIELLSYDNNNSTGVEPKMYVSNNLDKPVNIPIANDDVKTNEEKVQTEYSNEPTEGEDNDIKVGDTVNEAFDRLGKILKTHVYPSQTPDLDVYKIKPYFSEIFASTTNREPNPELPEVDEAFRTKPSSFNTGASVSSLDINSSAPDEGFSVKYKKENKTEIQDENNLSYPHYDKDTSNFRDYDEDTYHKEHTSSSQNLKGEQEHLPKDEYTIYKYGYPLFMNYLNYKPQPYYNDEEYSKEIDPPYKSKLQFYNKYSDSDDKDLENIYTGHGEVEDETKYKQKENIETVEEPSREIASSFRSSYPLNTLNKVKEEIIETPHYDTLETVEHPENKDVNSTKGEDELLDHAEPLQNKLHKVEESENTNNKNNETQSAPNGEKDSFLQKLQLVADLKTFDILSKLSGDKDAYHLYGVLVPVKQSDSSIQKNKSSEDNL